jgi:hypothetical protein
MTTAKILFNSVLSTPGARVAGADLTDFYLKTPMEWIPASIVPPEIMEEYDLEPPIRNGMILAEIRTGMYGLPQAGRLALPTIRYLSRMGVIMMFSLVVVGASPIGGIGISQR